ncbi:MAG: alpha/beta hydrolase [Zoogloeaceae bacterium]|nr:alpha/beta hydrolase [Zoogloeaceae bacterium]
MKLRDSRIALPADGHWLLARLHHSPQVRGLVIVIGAGHTEEPPEAPGLIEALHHHGFASLLLDLLTETEAERDPDAPFNIPLLAARTISASEWAIHQPDFRALPLLVVARGTACAAAVRAAGRHRERFRAIVCLGGRMDLAGATPLGLLTVPTRVIASENDPKLHIIEAAWSALPGGHDLRRLPDDDAPTHAARLALEWLAHWREVAPEQDDGER